ncbi:hypothetical protein CIPAW_09G117300 [Carya illinoinensis]|uniref:Uncharacterized protein n=1 Tax=Carya illinoinensis TaxID=32201 RepID=A0A8T1PD11_CARIL|nr:hypothetical protein CIPAW_09G117300 [Carya illinoinensis]KAG6642059.1 hypothetical protein CIPAW_09G117300 [Carya illinoinensis]
MLLFGTARGQTYGPVCQFSSMRACQIEHLNCNSFERRNINKFALWRSGDSGSE